MMDKKKDIDRDEIKLKERLKDADTENRREQRKTIEKRKRIQRS